MTIDGPVADGRPGAGQLLASEMAAAAENRGKRRDLRPLAKLGPFLQAHMGDALASAIVQIATDFCALQRKKSCAIN